MKKTDFRYVVAVVCFVMLLPFAAQAAQPIDPAAAKNLMRQRHAVQPHIVFQHDANLASCSAYVQLINKANADFRNCTNPDTPPPGSPIARFNAYSNMQLGQFCGNLTMQQCVDKVNADQQQYCHQVVMPVRQQAEAAKRECSQARAECNQAKQKLAGLEQKMPGLDARKKQLEAELAKVNAEINATQQAIGAARQEVQRQCGAATPVRPPQPAGGPVLR